jgi:hypothetical protein
LFGRGVFDGHLFEHDFFDHGFILSRLYLKAPRSRYSARQIRRRFNEIDRARFCLKVRRCYCRTLW